MRALRTAATGMAAQQLNVEVISNNIANMNTVGFKRQRAEFQDLLYQNVERMGAQSSGARARWCRPASRSASGCAPAASIGSPNRARPCTGQPLRPGHRGARLFQVLLPSGETAYTRAGNFSLNGEGQLVTEDGYQVQPAISIPQDARDVVISPTGQVQVIKAGTANPQSSASWSWPASSMRPAWKRSATTCCWKRPPPVPP
jgi:flagellar basal-body rod protein FlgG